MTKITATVKYRNNNKRSQCNSSPLKAFVSAKGVQKYGGIFGF